MSEREILEREVAGHSARVEKIRAALAGMDESGPEARLLAMELKGRSAAVEVGTARLKTLRD